MNTRHACRLFCFVLVSVAGSAIARADLVGRLSLDSASFVAFQGYGNLALPVSSTILFHFGDVQADGTAPFTVTPGDVTIGPIPVQPGATLHYGLASSSSGTIRKTAGGLQIDFEASVQASLEAPDGGGTTNYALRFTTQTASATNAAGTQTVHLTGIPVVQGPNYVQLVAGATNRPDAYPGPGAAVYGVLSGTFDQLPNLP
jgi:hypothetical protein